jgi:uncharacterized Fe-S center protein
LDEVEFRKAIHEVLIDRKKCDLCGECVEACPTDAIEIDDRSLRLRTDKCIACYGCYIVCPQKAIEIKWKYDEPEKL